MFAHGICRIRLCEVCHALSYLSIDAEYWQEGIIPGRPKLSDQGLTVICIELSHGAQLDLQTDSSY
jgi:hypothetical protein